MGRSTSLPRRYKTAPALRGLAGRLAPAFLMILLTVGGGSAADPAEDVWIEGVLCFQPLVRLSIYPICDNGNRSITIARRIQEFGGGPLQSTAAAVG